MSALSATEKVALVLVIWTYASLALVLVWGWLRNRHEPTTRIEWIEAKRTLCGYYR